METVPTAATAALLGTIGQTGGVKQAPAPSEHRATPSRGGRAAEYRSVGRQHDTQRPQRIWIDDAGRKAQWLPLAARLTTITATRAALAMKRLLEPRRGAVHTITLDNGPEFAEHWEGG